MLHRGAGLALHDGCLLVGVPRCAHIYIYIYMLHDGRLDVASRPLLRCDRRARTVASGEVSQRLSHAAEEVDHP